MQHFEELQENLKLPDQIPVVVGFQAYLSKEKK
jgi:hypothetical protein